MFIILFLPFFPLKINSVFFFVFVFLLIGKLFRLYFQITFLFTVFVKTLNYRLVHT